MRMSVNERTVSAWEQGREPLVTHYPAIIRFLGCEPWADPMTFSEKFLAARRRRGQTIEAAAADLCVDASTVWWWSAGRRPHRVVDRERLDAFIGNPVAAPLQAASHAQDGDDVRLLGRLLRDRRIALGLTRKQAATELHVNQFTLMNWELDRHTPCDRYYPTLILYLGREPWPDPNTFGARIRAQRLRQGLTSSQLAQLLRVDASSLASWERGIGPRHRSSREKVTAFVEGRPLARRGRNAKRALERGSANSHHRQQCT
jgi:transcriptional regulator with XRE-family HTH domain